jgi:hypothetical protein
VTKLERFEHVGHWEYAEGSGGFDLELGDYKQAIDEK